MDLVAAAAYADIEGRDRVENVPRVKQALSAVVQALPTTITPRDRTKLVENILDDLRGDDSAAWRCWPRDVLVLALQAVKVLGRNPVGTQCMASKRLLEVLLFHAGISNPSRSSSPSNKSSHSTRSNPSPPSFSASKADSRGLTATQTEAISALANTLTLHADPACKNALELGGGKGALRSLRDLRSPTSGTGKLVQKENIGSSWEEKVFLLCRVMFLLTVKPCDFVRELTDEEDGVATLVGVLSAFKPAPPNYKALSEVLKLVYNVIVHYAASGGKPTTSDEDEEWNDAFDPLLQPTVHLVHTLQMADLLPPLTNAINVLTLFPYTDKLAPVWLSMPPSSRADASRPDRRASSPKRRSLYNILSSNPFTSTNNQAASASSNGGGNLSPESAGSPSGGSPRSSVDSSPSENGTPTLVQKLLEALDNFLSNNLPALPLTPDDPLPSAARGIVMDEVLPPVFGLFTRMAMGLPAFREQLNAELLPDTLDRSPESGPLEKRPGLLGHLLRFLRSTSHPHCQQTLDCFFWALSGSDGNVLIEDIGYGNAAGLLFRRGMTAPARPAQPTATVEEINDDEDVEPAEVSPPSPARPSHRAEDTERDPITSLRPPKNPEPSPLAGMTDEEKEREAERLFVTFERMEKNPAMKMMENPMKAAVERGDTERWEVEDARREIEQAKLQEEQDEAEAAKEIAEWKRRMRGTK